MMESEPRLRGLSEESPTEGCISLQGCQNCGPQAGWLQQQELILSWFRRPRPRRPQSAFLWRPLLVDRGPLPVCSCGLPSACGLPSSGKNTGPYGIGPPR